jgi:hypothetical protein
MSSSSSSNLALCGEELSAHLKACVVSLVRDAKLLSHSAGLLKSLESNELAKETRNRMHQIEFLVTTLEDKANALQRVMNDEASALDDIEADLLATFAQRRDELEKLINRLQIREKENLTASDSVENFEHSVTEETLAHVSKNTLADSESSAMDRSVSTTSTAPSTNKMNLQGTLPSQPALPERSISPSTLLLSSSIKLLELHALPTTMRGRIGVAVVNDALYDIQQVAEQKSKKLAKQLYFKQHILTWDKGNDSSNHDAMIHLSEQELRQSCAFWRLGESTARAILMMLRTLRRIQRLPAQQHGDAVYAVPRKITDTQRAIEET